MPAAASMPFPRGPANYDEVSMQQSMLFSDSLKDLKNLRKQLYSAAEYFELSYTNDDQKHVVVNTLKDYAIKALVNTVDHLGSVTYKVNDLLDENIDEVSGTELRVSCLEQRLRTCHEYIDREGLSQQSLVINTPNYHKRYILPVGETMHGAARTKSKYQGCSIDNGDEWPQFKNAIRATIQEAPPSIVSKGCSPSPTPRLMQQSGNFAFSKSTPNKDLERRTVSPHRFPLLRSGSLSLSSKPTTPKSSRPSTPNQSRPTTPNPSLGRQPYISEPRKSASMRIRVGKESPKEFEQIPSKSKRLLKALLSRRKSKKDDMLYTYLDEY
ncbi:ABL interactor-like protein 3 [Perilla frutescens var. hirtella]|uniref:ABL interactor-like protein 3 n=1 Tax=Perilla frutescens var. hirtella TaxID=608512 RepID=A0AAD4IVC1_PERFH|nr:ABL interactor-like protein 3 [Perilla frutescens var. frutescens]KAH6784079.1 ABL interactor-like protein 3 [Perilla frutescens var. hirtella]KAH6822179.1 ABL interactor-like protein 3 [Perilla frutescens var. hirtella]